jgi:hypothetical protein
MFMRDPKRIEKLLDIIRIIWKNNSDLRWQQLMDFIESNDSKYYMEDEEFIKILNEQYCSHFRKPVDWCVKHDLIVLDPDGWFDKDFDEPISEPEFVKRAMDSTCRGNMSVFKIFNKNT